MLGLCRVYEDHREALTLRTVIQALMQRPSFLGDFPSIPDVRLQADLDSVSRRHTNSRSVKHLLMWRDKLYAHRDPDKVVSGWTLGENYPLPYKDVNALIDNAFRIVNGYSVTIFGVSYSRQIVGADDYLTLLQTVQQAVETKQALAEMEASSVQGSGA